MLSKRFFTISFIVIILILSAGLVSAKDMENQTLSEYDSPILNDTIPIEEETGQYIQTQIDNAKENDTLEFNGTYEIFNSIRVDKSIALEGSQDNTKLYYATFNINSGKVKIENMMFNSAIELYIINAKNEKLDIVNCTFERGAPIYFTGAELTVSDCTFKNCDDGIKTKGGTIEIRNCTFENLERTSIYSSDGKITITDCLFLNSMSSIYINQNKLSTIRNNRFKNCTYQSTLYNNTKIVFEGNEFDQDSIKIDDVKEISVKNNRFINSALGGSSKADVYNCDFISSYFIMDKCKSINNCNFINITSEFFITRGIKFNNCSFINNTCEYLFGCDETVDISNSTFINNTGDYLLYSISAKKATLTNSRFIKNKLNESIIYLREGTSLNIEGCEFLDNGMAKNLLDILEIKDVKIIKSVFSNNTCLNALSLRYLDSHIDYNAKITTSFEISNNIFAQNGGKIYLYPKIASNIYQYRWGTNFTIENNFYGFNIENDEEFEILSPVHFQIYAPKKAINWVNVELEKNGEQYTLKFIDTNRNIQKLPDYSFSIVERATGRLIVSQIQVKSGKATFTCDEELSENDIYILNSALGIVNKPKATLAYTASGSSYKDFKITVQLTGNGHNLSNQNINYEIIPHGKIVNVESDEFSKTTDSEGKITITYFQTSDETNIIDYDVTLTFANENYSLTKLSIKSIVIKPIEFTLTLKDVTSAYNTYTSGNTNIKMSEIKAIDTASKKPVEDITLDYYIYKGNKLIYEATLNLMNGGVYIYNPPIAQLSVGTYKIVAKSRYGKYKAVKKTATLKITKAKASVKAPKVTNKYKKSKYFKVTVKANKKLVKNLKLKVKIYTGKKYKTHNIKTNSKGVASLNTKSLKVGTHKVVITSGNSNYQVSAKSTIKIKKS